MPAFCMSGCCEPCEDVWYVCVSAPGMHVEVYDGVTLIGEADCPLGAGPPFVCIEVPAAGDYSVTVTGDCQFEGNTCSKTFAGIPASECVPNPYALTPCQSLGIHVVCGGVGVEGASVTITGPGGEFGPLETNSDGDVLFYVCDDTDYDYEIDYDDTDAVATGTVTIDGNTEITVDVCEGGGDVEVECCDDLLPETVTATLGTGTMTPVGALCGGVTSVFGSHAGTTHSLTYDAMSGTWIKDLGPNGMTAQCYYNSFFLDPDIVVSSVRLAWDPCAGSSIEGGLLKPYGHFSYTATWSAPAGGFTQYIVAGDADPAGSPCPPVAEEFNTTGATGAGAAIANPIATVTE